MSEGERPFPVPRPRQLKAVDEPDAATKVYENYKLPEGKPACVYDSLIAELNVIKQDNVHRPVPTPRARVTVAERRDYENSPESAKTLNNQQNDDEIPKKTGAIRKAPNIPSVRNNLDESDSAMSRSAEAKDFDVMSQTSSTSNRSGGDSKFSTPSPG